MASTPSFQIWLRAWAGYLAAVATESLQARLLRNLPAPGPHPLKVLEMLVRGDEARCAYEDERTIARSSDVIKLSSWGLGLYDFSLEWAGPKTSISLAPVRGAAGWVLAIETSSEKAGWVRLQDAREAAKLAPKHTAGCRGAPADYLVTGDTGTTWCTVCGGEVGETEEKCPGTSRDLFVDGRERLCTLCGAKSKF